MEKTKEQVAQGIIRFAEKNHLHIHPGQDPNRWADLVLIKGGCPCVPGRNSCPCAHALEDIQKLGRCRCGLFANDEYLVQYNGLVQNGKNHKNGKPAQNHSLNLPELNGHAREEFLTKAVINGFSIEDNGVQMTLRPRGIEDQAEITIEDDPGNGYRVVSASGKYKSFSRGLKRKYFEDHVNRWVIECLQKVP